MDTTNLDTDNLEDTISQEASVNQEVLRNQEDLDTVNQEALVIVNQGSEATQVDQVIMPRTEDSKVVVLLQQLTMLQHQASLLQLYQ